jgi:hypothetical protein
LDDDVFSTVDEGFRLGVGEGAARSSGIIE